MHTLQDKVCPVIKIRKVNKKLLYIAERLITSQEQITTPLKQLQSSFFHCTKATKIATDQKTGSHVSDCL